MGQHLYHINLTMLKHSHKDTCYESSLFAVMEAKLSVLEALLLFPAERGRANQSSPVDCGGLTLLTSAGNIINQHSLSQISGHAFAVQTKVSLYISFKSQQRVCCPQVQWWLYHRWGMTAERRLYSGTCPLNDLKDRRRLFYNIT